MLMIRSIVRPEKADNVLAALMEAGFPGITKMSVVGRGKQRGIKIGEITYDEIPKEMILAVVKNQDKDFVIKTIIQAARTGDKGAYGDGKIFVVPVEEAYTISSGIKETSAGEMTEGFLKKGVVVHGRQTLSGWCWRSSAVRAARRGSQVAVGSTPAARKPKSVRSPQPKRSSFWLIGPSSSPCMGLSASTASTGGSAGRGSTASSRCVTQGQSFHAVPAETSSR